MTKPAKATALDIITISQASDGTWYGGDLSLPSGHNDVYFDNHSNNPCEIYFVEKGHFDVDTLTVAAGETSQPATVKVRKKTHYTVGNPKAQGQHRRDIEIDISIDITEVQNTVQQYTIDMN